MIKIKNMSMFIKTKHRLTGFLRKQMYNQLPNRNYIKTLESFKMPSGIALDLGSGPTPKNPFFAKEVYGVDIRSYEKNTQVRKATLGFDKIPFPDGAFEAISSFDVLEHIPRVAYVGADVTFPFINLMNEVWRTLKTGGYFFSTTPCFPAKEAFQDPTHINIMTEDTIRLYFCGNAWARIYGFYGSFDLVEEGWSGPHYWALVRKSSDKPRMDLDSPQRSVKK